MSLPPFLVEQSGEIRLSGSRIGLAHLVRSYRRGNPAEMIALEFPTIPAMRVRVSSSCSGSGDNGMNKPLCVTRGFVGLASIRTPMTAAPGGCASSWSINNFVTTRGFWTGNGNRREVMKGSCGRSRKSVRSISRVAKLRLRSR